MNFVVSSLQLSVDKYLYTVLALPLHSLANIELSSLIQILAEETRGCHAWSGLFHAHLLLDTMGVLAVPGG